MNRLVIEKKEITNKTMSEKQNQIVISPPEDVKRLTLMPGFVGKGLMVNEKTI